MSRREVCCDLCMGKEYEPYLEPGPSGRNLVRCLGCGLVIAGPNGVDGAAREPARRDPRTDLRRAAAVMKILPAGKVLEVGCGEGHFLSALDPDRYEVVGTETDAEAAAAAGRRIAEAGLRGAVVQGSPFDASLPAEVFDLVALFGSIASAPSPRSTCMEVTRVLRAGGFSVIETPSLSSLTALLCGAWWPPLRDPRADYFFTPASLELLMSTCGLTSGASRLPMPAGWPAPGTLVYVARKSSITHRAASLSDLASNVGGISPMGATH